MTLEKNIHTVSTPCIFIVFQIFQSASFSGIIAYYKKVLGKSRKSNIRK
ncbi:hypothetical protein HMPREF1548_00620 [Clostridium sp. KLE 1755]|nr:hypothetical protein HMPREF1548_00620 [Clostridium sp. KLE 1755]